MSFFVVGPTLMKMTTVGEKGLPQTGFLNLIWSFRELHTHIHTITRSNLEGKRKSFCGGTSFCFLLGESNRKPGH